ncbi:MAG: heme biosynthesis HemY N-terminal domain-containing protein [Burkholderiaceae bacterium]
MRWIVWVILILSAAVGMALLLRFNHGNVALFWPPYRIDISVNLLVLVLAIVFFVLHFGLIGLSKALDLPTRVREYRSRRQRDAAIQALRDGVLAFFEGRFGRAERLAQKAREDAALAGPAALIGARAAHRLREAERRDRWLASVEEDQAAQQAFLMTAAEVAVDDQDAPRALTHIHSLHNRGARHIQSLRLALKAYEQAEDWPKVLQLARQLEKREALHPAAIRGLKLRALRALIAQRSGDPAGLRELYAGLPANEREQPELIEAAAAAFSDSGDEQTALKLIDQGMQRQLSPGLLRRYLALRSIPARERLSRAERWRDQYGDDPALMLTLGRLCMDEALWGKAEEFLRMALRAADPAPAHYALAELFEAIDRPADASTQYRLAAAHTYGQGRALTT